MLKARSIDQQGFSAVEIVVAAVVLVAVAGLGFYAFNKRVKKADAPSSASAASDSELGETAVLPNISASLKAHICKKGVGNYKATFALSKKLKSPFKTADSPRILARDKRKVVVGTWRGTQLWWNGNVQVIDNIKVDSKVYTFSFDFGSVKPKKTQGSINPYTGAYEKSIPLVPTSSIKSC
jgi:hypothetical protein